jgi:ATP-dependent RNA helicase DDX46/PRP5
MFDMGFSPQITAILSAVRPDRQTVLFSATFPKAVETLARKSLKYPIEVIVGGRSVATDSVTQFAEVVEEEEKFLRLLQLLGEHCNDGHKVIIFVDTQTRTDTVFEQLMRCGYPALSLHGGKDQEDRDSTISDFRDPEGPNILVATSVAGRGLDVPSCTCVINYSSPNHIEEYVHRIGRSGRAGKKGCSYTFVSSSEEAKYAPIIVRAMVQAGQEKNIHPNLLQLSDDFTEKVKRGEARYAGSGFKGKGFTYDASELSEAQKIARLEKRQALIDAGMIDPDDEDGQALLDDDLDESGFNGNGDTPDTTNAKDPLTTIASLQSNLSAEVMALPGMKEAILRKAGIEPSSGSGLSSSFSSLGSNHFMEEIEINDYPREARFKVTQKDTAARLQDEFHTSMTLKGKYFAPNTQPGEGERRLYLHLEAGSVRILQAAIQEVRRLLNEETLRVASRASGPGSTHRYNVLG